MYNRISYTINRVIKFCTSKHKLVKKILRIMSTETVTRVEENLQLNHKRPLEDTAENIAKKVQKTEDLCSSRKRKKYAMLMSYSGANYLGMQRNPGCNTIEEQLLIALKKANFIEDKMFEEAQLMAFQRAARTDKGVSAAKQVVSIKLPEEVNKEEVNKFLPNDIRVLGIKRVTKAFNSKNFCSARTYLYIIPTHVFAVGDNASLIEDTYTIEGKPYKEYRMTPALLQEIQTIGQLFVGTHNCHNVTSKMKPADPRAYRTLYTFNCTETFVSNNMEFAILTIKGQSFLLHQIRKMMCLLIATSRNMISKDEIPLIFSRQKYRIGRAPGLGLILRNLHYDNYDKKFGKDGLHEPLTWDDCEEEVKKFLNDSIIKHIIDTECADHHTLKWLQSRDYHILKGEEEIEETDQS